MSQPSVCCVCLTADRQRFTDRAVKCFLSQSYQIAHLLIYDTGANPYVQGRLGASRITTVWNPSSRGKRIGALRNEAIDMVKADIIVTWDSDDWSDAERVACQVMSLEGHAATGFHNLLFLDTREMVWSGISNESPRGANAWEHDYLRYGGAGPMAHVQGSSLAFWRKTWEHYPYAENLRDGEDARLCKSVPVHAVNGVGLPGADEPLLIAEVHGGNTSRAYQVFDRYQAHVNPEWRRAPEWDEYCRRKLYP